MANDQHKSDDRTFIRELFLKLGDHIVEAVVRETGTDESHVREVFAGAERWVAAQRARRRREDEGDGG